MTMLNKTEAMRRIANAVQMNGLERVIATVAPGVALRRAQNRAALALSGAYVGGSRTRRSMSEWSVSQGDADTDLLYDLPTLRERSRDHDRNNPIAHGAFKTKCLNVIGPGLKLRPQLDREALGMTEDEADALENQIKREWRLFWMTQEVDAARTCNGPELEWMGYKQTKVNGDVIVLFPRISREGSPYETKVQVVEADRLCNKDNAPDSEELAGGVKKGKFGDPLEYHIAKQHPGKLLGGKSLGWDVIPAYGKKTGLRNVLHIYRPERPGQSRGIPDLAPVIEALKQIGRYTEAEIDAAVLSAFFTVFIKTNRTDGTTGTPLKVNSAVDGNGGMTADQYKLGKGTIIGLGENEDISTASPGRPNPNFDPFFVAIARQIGVALGLPFEVLIKHFTASYSAARAALLEAWKYFIVEREWWALKFNQAIYEMFFYEAVSLGRISAPGFFDDPIIRQAYLGADWIGPARGMINEKDELTASKMRVDMTVSTLDEETAQITGGDWEAKLPQRAKEQKKLKAAGLVPEEQNQQSRFSNQNPDKPEQPEKEDDEQSDEE